MNNKPITIKLPTNPKLGDTFAIKPMGKPFVLDYGNPDYTKETFGPWDEIEIICQNKNLKNHE